MAGLHDDPIAADGLATLKQARCSLLAPNVTWITAQKWLRKVKISSGMWSVWDPKWRARSLRFACWTRSKRVDGSWAACRTVTNQSATWIGGHIALIATTTGMASDRIGCAGSQQLPEWHRIVTNVSDTPEWALAMLLISSIRNTVLPTPAPPNRPIFPPLMRPESASDKDPRLQCLSQRWHGSYPS